MMHMFGEYGMGMGYFGMVFMIFFWILIIVLIGYFIKMIIDKGRGGESMETAEYILKKRYAKGEINKDEFDKMKNDLSG